MVDSGVTFTNEQALASMLWVIHKVSGRDTRLGPLESGSEILPSSESSDLGSEIATWARSYDLERLAGRYRLRADDPSLSQTFALRTLVAEHAGEIDEWFGDVGWNQDTLMSAQMGVHRDWLLHKRSARGRVERFFVIPVRRMHGVRVSSDTYLVSRLLTETDDVFQGWARGRRKLAERPLDYWLQIPDGTA